MSSMYELRQQWQAVLDMATDPEVDEQAIIDTLGMIEADIEAKADNYAIIIRTLQADSTACGDEIKRLQARKKSLDANTSRLKQNLYEAMVAVGKTKFKTELNSFGTRKSERVVIDDDAEIDEQYRKIKIDFDRTAIKQAIKAGETIKGASLFTHESLSIR